MRISAPSLEAIEDVILGDDSDLPYRTGPELVELFQRYGWHKPYEAGIPSRPAFVRARLAKLNGQYALRSLIEEVLDPRCFFKSKSSSDIVAQRLNQYLEYDSYHLNREGKFYRVRDLSEPVVSPKTSVFGEGEEVGVAINDQLEKCRVKLESEDFEGAITNARSLVESVLVWLEKELSPVPCDPYNGDLPRLYKRVNKLLNLEPDRKDLSDSLKQILRGFVSIVTGLASLRNMMGDAHAITYNPYEHHARLAVNASHTLVDFLFGTYAYQRKKGKINSTAKSKRRVSSRHSSAPRSPDRTAGGHYDA